MKRSSAGMKLLMSFAPFVFFILPVSAHDAGVSASASDEAAIRASVKLMEEGWNTKSGALFAKPFAEDADYVIINGMYIKGRVAIDKGHQQIFDTIFKNTKISLSVKQIRFLRPDVAVVHVNGHRDGPTADLVSDAILTLVMTKGSSGWQIDAFQNTQVIGNLPR
jgi:uncharacterized protein (TIGR02246 family)